MINNLISIKKRIKKELDFQSYKFSIFRDYYRIFLKFFEIFRIYVEFLYILKH